MAKTDNLKDFLTDVADAIREKTGESSPINPQDFSQKILDIESGGASYTGHADVEGLKAIGWTDEDIAYYQENGVNWNEEDDEYHKVTDDNKALYGVLTADNISTYKDRIVYLPKIDTSAKTSMRNMFNQCYSLVAIPLLNTQNVTNMSSMFSYCWSLVTIPLLDTQNVTNMSSMFSDCYSLVAIPLLDTQNVTSMSSMFNKCYSLVTIPLLNTQNVASMQNMFNYCYSLVAIPLLNTQDVTDMSSMFSCCYSLVTVPLLNTQNVKYMGTMFQSCTAIATIPQLDMKNVTSMTNTFSMCHSLTNANIKNLTRAISFKDSSLLSKESLLYLINNEASTAAFTITLKAYAYTRLAEDADIVAALANHPNVSLASA